MCIARVNWYRDHSPHSHAATIRFFTIMCTSVHIGRLLRYNGAPLPRIVRVFFFSFIILRSGWGKTKIELTTLPCIFIHVVCRFNSAAFAVQLIFWRVSFGSRDSNGARCPYRRSTIIFSAILGFIHIGHASTSPSCTFIFLKVHTKVQFLGQAIYKHHQGTCIIKKTGAPLSTAHHTPPPASPAVYRQPR